MEKIALNVTGMKCGGCESSIQEKVSAIDGVVSVSASHKESSVAVEFDAAKTSVDDIRRAIADAGFSVQ